MQPTVFSLLSIEKMKSIRDWAFSQLVSNSVALSRPLPGSDHFSSVTPQDAVLEGSDAAQSSDMVASEIRSDVNNSSRTSQGSSCPTGNQVIVEECPYSSECTDHKNSDPLFKIEALQVKFLRILQRLGQSPEKLVVAKVLYRLHLATLIRAGESDLKRINLRTDQIRSIAAKQEAARKPIDFSLRILVLGKTGVGKSATINSIFDQSKAVTSAFQPATKRIQEVAGTVNGIAVTVIDTPGFLPLSTCNVRRNRKNMLSIKKYIRKRPPDIVLYLERLDLVNTSDSDFSLLKLITEVFGSALWFNTIHVMTHAASALPEGPNGYPISYESYVTRCSDLLQFYVHQAVSDTKIETPVLLVENHPNCRRNIMGEKILPNGQVWKSELLLLCVCTKVLGDANAFLRFQDSIELGPSNSSRLPSLPHLLSSLLRQRSVVSPNEADDNIDDCLLSDADEEDEYDQLPPIRILTKGQFEKLDKSQKKEYLEELDYRETLFLKKKLKEDLHRQKEKKRLKEASSADGDDPDCHELPPEAVQLPDMAIPPSFDSDSSVHRYRCMVTGDQWFWRPVLDPQGWDHDVGFDGISLESVVEVNDNVIASVAGQMSKDKQHSSIHSECAAAYADPRGPMYLAGLDVQSSGKDLIYTIHSNAKMGKIKQNIPGCGMCLTSFQEKYFVGAKLEDTLYIGKRLKFVMNGGRVGSFSQAAYGGSLEATIRGGDYPVRNDHVSMSMNVLSFSKEVVLGGNFESEFRPTLGMRLSVNANLNSRKMGKVCVEVSSSEHLEVAVLALFCVLRAVTRRRVARGLMSEKHVGEGG